MRTLSSFNHSGPDEVPIAILLRQTTLEVSMGSDPIERRPSSGGRPGWAIPHGTGAIITDPANTRMGGAERYPSRSRLVGFAQLTPPTNSYAASAGRTRLAIS